VDSAFVLKPVLSVFKVWDTSVGESRLPKRLAYFLGVVFSFELAPVFRELGNIRPAWPRRNSIVNDPLPDPFSVSPDFFGDTIGASIEGDILLY
jgi:hypothetical protein